MAISWPHDGVHRPGPVGIDDLVVAFDRPVIASTLHEYSYEVYFRLDRGDPVVPYRSFLFHKLDGIITPLEVTADCGSDTIKIVSEKPDPDKVTGVRFQPRDPNLKPVSFVQGHYLVLLEGNFILGLKEIEVDGVKRNPALDGEHFAMGLRGAAPNKRCPSGDGIEGGTFRSWFRIGD